ncbi:MAG TPA: DNA polymerase III subunit delta [Actinomycetota bacterium]|nr:DNA polymerase III subunit delta [Actinomycetota bacterium]
MTAPKAPVHLLWGEDAFLLREAALEIVGPDVQAREIDAADWQGGELADLATPSLFGEARALIVTDCRSLPDEGLRELALYLSVPDPAAPLVLCATVGERAKAPAALVKLVQPVGPVREVKLARKDLPGWLVQRGQRRGLDLAPEAAAALVETLGEDRAALDQGVVQLGSAFPGERLTRELVAQQFRGLGDQHIWDLCDRAFARDVDGAMRSLRTLLESGDDGLKILGGVASRLRDLLRVRSLPDRMPPTELARAAGLRFEWQARRYREQARRFSLEELVEIHAQAVDADRALKSGASDEVVLPVLIGRIAGEPARV